MFAKFKSHFNETFRQLVPNGDCQISLVDTPTQQSNLGTQRKLARGIRIVPLFEGMPSSVTTDRDGNLMNLSPGQRAILSIAILFALHKCNPSPFYCFDEIDADLDSTYVRNIGKLVNEMSKHSQVFITTFRHESLVYNQASAYRVEMVGGNSQATKISMQEAREALVNK